MNVFGLSVTLSLDEQNTDDAYIDFNLTVDGQYPHELDAYVDPVDLAVSAAMGGELFIFTCSCGNPACVGIDEGVLVSHTADAVHWKLRNPVSWPPDEPLPDWAQTVELAFDRNEYRTAVSRALAQAKALVSHWRSSGKLWVGPDLTVKDLLALEVPGNMHVQPTGCGRTLH
ncbi:hypothetical protein [Pseudodesulfovibrio tunisiensis]|uniref:hypothetical protein n=1 Tax=Pseudodesulfovibrio tunisiensis TaxID=463192 RepID=UPI001FB326F8|nr:hypothetical protein [Pseudodesulfovibrio tunisiensis]